jgi:hypothetical protein
MPGTVTLICWTDHHLQDSQLKRSLHHRRKRQRPIKIEGFEVKPQFSDDNW